MRKGWKSCRLNELAELRLGKMLDQNKNKGEFYDYLANVNVQWGNIVLDDLKQMKFETKEFDRYGLNIGDIVMCEGGEPGRCAIWKGQRKVMMIQKALHRIRPKATVDGFFLYYYLLNEGLNGSFEGYFTGSTIKHFTGINLANVEINLPPLETQQKIANILSIYDDLIENNQKRIKILEEMTQQTYEEWFVRMRFPNYETAVFGEDGLPESWEKVKLGDLGDVVTGKTPSTFNEEFYNGKIPFIKTPDMNGQIYVLETSQNLTELGANTQKNKFIPKNSLVISCIGSAGVYALVSKDSQFNQQINAIKFSKEIYTYYTYCFSKSLKEVLEALGSNGATMTNVNKGKFEQIEIIIPQDKLLLDFHNLAKPCFESILNLQSQNKSLREGRDILLPRLMMGMIDLENLESKSTDAKVIPLEQSKREASKEFKEAVLIACLTERFGSEKFPLGRKRYTKLSYLFHRYSDNKIQDYLRKAAGPYNPKTKYGGPEKIALNNKYLQNWKGDKGTTGFVVAEKIDDAKKYFSNYWQIADLDWLVTEFKFKSNDELELLATVDNSLVELSKKNMEFTSANVLDIIKSEKEWEVKLERTIFSDANVERAIRFLTETLQYEK